MQYDSFFDEDGPGYFDYNPAHAVWYLLVQAGFPESRLNSESFLAAAITIYEEGKVDGVTDSGQEVSVRGGISARLTSQIGVKEYIIQLLAHMNGVMTWANDGKFHLLLIRDNYSVEDLPIVNENVLLEEPMIDRASWPETYGEISVQYNKRIYPPAGLRYYHEAVEVIRKGRPFLRNYGEIVEVLHAGRPYVINYQEAVEVLHQNIYSYLDDISILWTSVSTTTTTTNTITTSTTSTTIIPMDGLELWLDADDDSTITESSNLVSEWRDKSGSSNHAGQSGDPEKYTLVTGSPASRQHLSSANGDHMDLTSEIANVRSIYIVEKHDGSDSDYRFIVGSGASWYDFHGGITSIFYNLWINANIYPNGIIRLDGVVIPNPTVTNYSGSWEVLTIETAGNVRLNRLGEDREIANRNWLGDYAEVLIYNRILDSDEKKVVRDYIYDKWGVQAYTTTTTT
jgi:hypothetical protein